MSREIVEAAESILDKPVQVLDHGFVTLVEYMGGDASIVKAARNCVGITDEVRTREEDVSLIRYLLRNKHTSPFEFVEMIFHMKMPVFVARQMIRHRTASVSEASARYSPVKEEFYIPDKHHINFQSALNNQGGMWVAPEEIQHRFQEIEEYLARASFEAYNTFIGKEPSVQILEKDVFDGLVTSGGIARETARIMLPLAMYTSWYWKMDLHNLMHLLKLRMDSHAQSEIREYANIMFTMAKKVAPITMEAFEDFELFSMTLTKDDIAAITSLRNHAKKGTDDDDVLKRFKTRREKAEFLEKITELGLLDLLYAKHP